MQGLWLANLVKQTVLYRTAKTVGQRCYCDNGRTVDKSVDILSAMTEEVFQCAPDKTLRGGEDSKPDSKPLQFSWQPEQVGGNSSGAGHHHCDSVVGKFHGKSSRKDADVSLCGTVHGNAGHGHPARHR